MSLTLFSGSDTGPVVGPHSILDIVVGKVRVSDLIGSGSQSTIIPSKVFATSG